MYIIIHINIMQSTQTINIEIEEVQQKEVKEVKEIKEVKKRTKKVIPVCQICDEKLNKSTHQPIKCEYCSFDACRTCCETYALNEPTIKCMNTACGREWTRKFIRETFTLVFINGTLKQHREQILFDRERALLPMTQPIIERKIACAKIDKQVSAVREQISILNNQISDLYRERNLISTNTRTNTAERASFVRACPDEDCRGFLSSQWKCGICEKWTCPDCHVIKGYTRDAVHTCDADELATARLLAADTKPCPKCATGIFKIDGCFAKDTQIPLFDGTTKMSQDICIGDVLVGDDGLQRTVLDTTTGIDEMYEVVQNKGINYTVNSKHTLAFKYCGDKTISWQESTNRWKLIWFDRTTKKQKTKDFKICEFESKDLAFMAASIFKDTLKFDDVIEIMVDDYMKLDNTVKRNLMGYKSNGINYNHIDVELDPYMLGIWLGDGIHSRPEIATNDSEIVDYINEWCKINKAAFVYEKNNKYKIRIKQLNISGEKQGENPFSKLLRKYNLLNNKHIPNEYLMNSRTSRLSLLAGIIDTDGHVSSNGKRITVIQTRDELSMQIMFLARSLGFIVNHTIRERKNCTIFGLEPKDYKNQYIINISGDLICEIPTLISRKKCMNSNANKDHLRTSVQVNKLENGMYYGWQVDENHRFILPDFTVVKNCDQMWCTQCHTAFSWRTGAIQNAVHNPHYYEWLRRSNGGEAPRNPGDVLCAREMNHELFSTISRIIRQRHVRAPNAKACISRCDSIIRNTTHLNYVERRPPVNYERRNEDLRVKYLMKEITETEMKIQLQKDDKFHNRNQEQSNIFQMISTTVADIMFRFLHYIEAENPYIEGIEGFSLDILDEIDPIVKYANECLADVSYTYSCSKIVFASNVQLHRGYGAERYLNELKEKDIALQAQEQLHREADAQVEAQVEA